ncbi:COP9 signalosome complex subunit 1 [Phytophthora cactorum]|nr:COP9 signalosome complex subunit 1 [Phytophthora cactorum]
MAALVGFDVEAYAAKYNGRNRTDRLLFLTKTCPALEGEAKRALLRELKGSLNMGLYAELLGDKAKVEASFIDNVKHNAAQQHERLEQELNSYKSTMIKESIRMGHNDLGDFYYELGDLASALKSFAQARDYCTTDKHIIEMCLNVSKVALHMRNFGHVTNYLTKLEQVSSSQSDPILKSKIASAFGLVALHDKNYHGAASKFIECSAEIGASYNEVLHAEDIALYGGICALASFKREELKEKVINNSSFKAFLELLPWLRELITDFYSSNYASCLQTLEQIKPELKLDLYLCEHVENLCKEIRSRGIIQYFFPYLSVDLHQMARTFNTPTADLEKEICDLIAAERLHARMDSYQKVLYAYHPNQRAATYDHSVTDHVGKDWCTYKCIAFHPPAHLSALTRLEANVSEVRDDVYQLRHDTNQGSETVRGEVSGVFNSVNNMTSKLKEYENAMEVFQNNMRAHQNHLSVLSTKVKKEKEHIQVVDTFSALQGVYDLQPFTIPDDMKLKVETRIRQQEASKREADARAAAELADAYRRLQLASASSNNPRLSELHLSLDQCQQEVKRAFQLIRTSNLQLYSFCESKAERMDFTALQNEVKQLRGCLREIESSPAGHRSKQLQLHLGSEIMNGPSDELMVGDKGPSLSMKKGTQHLSNAQIPVLRVSLLELSRNLNLLKHRWKKHKRLNPNSGTSVNPVAQKHLDKLVALINDAYSTMAQEPVDLAAAESHVEKVGRVLGSDFSMQILALLGGRSDEPESCRFPVAITARAAAGEMASALCRYSEAFTDMFFRREADNKVATAAMNDWASEKRTLENVGREVSALTRSHHVLETTLAKLAAEMQKKGDAGNVEGDILRSWTTLGDELQQLKGQIDAMSKQFITEAELVEILRDLKREQQNSPSSASLLKRVENDSSANKMLAAITLEPPEDRPRSQTKLDPLQGVKMNGSTRHSGRPGSGENGGLVLELPLAEFTHERRCFDRKANTLRRST